MSDPPAPPPGKRPPGIQPPDSKANLRRALVKSLLLPALVLIFFIAAPHWLNSRVRSSIVDEIHASPKLSEEQKQERIAFFSHLDLGAVCRHPSPEQEKLREALVSGGVAATFQRLRWGLFLSIALAGVLGLAVAAMFLLNRKARESQAALIRCYRLSWKIGIAAALLKIVLLIPLLTYGLFEFPVLLTDHYYPKLLVLIALGGIIALVRSVQILLKKIPLEFKEPMSRPVTPEDAPELWQSVRQAAERMQTAPPDRIVIGIQLNFYVTEMAVLTDSGRVEGKTLYLSYPLLKQLSADEVLAVIGHELGHFIGEDTRMTREFYPLRLKAHATMIAMARSGWAGWPSGQLLNFFGWCFGETEQRASRMRELVADAKGAALTSPRIVARALVKFQILTEAFNRNLAEAIRNQNRSALDVPLQAVIQEKLLPQTEFWTQLFEKNLPHPLDSHPPLRVRVEALGQNIGVNEAQAMAMEPTESAYARWFPDRDNLFTELSRKAESAVNKMRSKAHVAEADYQTAAGRELLDQHFPEKRWRTRPGRVWFALVFLIILVAVSVAAGVFIDEPAFRIVAGCFVISLSLCCMGAWRRHHASEFLLNAGGVNYTGWKRPLPFKDVRSLQARKQYSYVTLKFRLKEKQPAIWKFSVPGLSHKSVSVSLSGLEGKPAANAQTIFDYYTRQIKFQA